MSDTDTLTKDTIARLLDGNVSEEELRNEILPDPKDPQRFKQVREILQERVEWDDPILVPLNDHLFVVGTEQGRVVRGECGHDFCDFGDNWKLQTRVRAREERETMNELYPGNLTPDPDWEYQIREFFCPKCFELLEVEAVPRGYPILQKFEPDVDTFYEQWLDESPPDKQLRE